MKKQLTLIAALLFSVLTSFGQAKFDNWAEMKDFHTVLAQTFHPAEEGDLKPIRARSHELFAKSKMLNASPIPGEFDSENMRKTLKRMEKEADKLNGLVVRQEQNATIMKQLNIVHSTFHDIMGMCKKEDQGQTSN
jgi:hypothetical protein